jgi:hypothetical protein
MAQHKMHAKLSPRFPVQIRYNNQPNTMNQIETSKLHTIIKEIVNHKIQRGEMFTAYDVLKAVRDKGELACYPQVNAILELMMANEFAYDFRYRSFDNGRFWERVYHPLHVDACSYYSDRRLFYLPEFMTYAEAKALDPTREEIEYLFRTQGWDGVASLFVGYEKKAMEIIDPDGAYWGPEHAKDIQADPVGTFDWLKDRMIEEIAQAEERQAEDEDDEDDEEGED